MFFGSPLTYRFAPFIASLLGRAYDTWKEAKTKHYSCTSLLHTYGHSEVLRCTEGTVVKYKIVSRPSSNFKFLPLFSK